MLSQSVPSRFSSKTRDCDSHSLPIKTKLFNHTLLDKGRLGAGIKETSDNLLQPLDPHRTAGTVCRITFSPELTAMELATMEDDEGGVVDEDGGSEDFELASSG